MPTPCNNYVVPLFEIDECNGERKSASCVFDSSIYTELGLSENASQQEINQAIYLAFLNLKATTEDIDATVSGLDGSETKIEAGDNITVTGSGTTVNPYIVSSTVSPLPYKSYVALLTQTGTNDPIAYIAENEANLTVTFTRNSSGNFTGTMPSGYVAGKTTIITGSCSVETIFTAAFQNTTTIVLRTFVNQSGTNTFYDDELNSTFFEIRIYN